MSKKSRLHKMGQDFLELQKKILHAYINTEIFDNRTGRILNLVSHAQRVNNAGVYIVPFDHSPFTLPSSTFRVNF